MDEIGLDIQFDSAIIGSNFTTGSVMTTFGNIWSTNPDAEKKFIAKMKRIKAEKQGKQIPSLILISAILGIGIGAYLIFKSLEG